MKTAVVMKLLTVLALLACALSAQAADLTGFPFTDEDLAYSINWPTGLGLGESHIHARHVGANWNFDLTLDAGIPGYQVKDLYRSVASASFCTVSFNKNTAHGQHHAEEKEIVEASTEVTRTTAGGGGESHLVAPNCVKDALTLLFYARRELGQGRVLPAQTMLFGGLYPIKMEYAGEQTIKVNEKPTVTDKINCTVTGASEIKFEIYFARDAARTPLVVRVPFAAGTFSMELIR